MSARASKSGFDLDALTGNLAALRMLAGDEMAKAALEILREDLALTPEKLALMFKRAIAPDAIIKQGDEALLRGIPKRDTLTEYKAQGHFPHFINGHFEKGQRA